MPIRKVRLDLRALLIGRQSEERKKPVALFASPSWSWRWRRCAPRRDSIVAAISLFYRGHSANFVHEGGSMHGFLETTHALLEYRTKEAYLSRAKDLCSRLVLLL